MTTVSSGQCTESVGWSPNHEEGASGGDMQNRPIEMFDFSGGLIWLNQLWLSTITPSRKRYKIKDALQNIQFGKIHVGKIKFWNPETLTVTI